ncbi:hypothetical protein EZV62_020336 [Acer yangbiense]|uniref:Uncharacterized protein n=1 Tax=Acer yangbiense TaxID=1000413 RepID=A0A5C7HDK7_9ROSI|nr:hypothetical protein EZV62_020336 [Acer yangbiense]
MGQFRLIQRANACLHRTSSCWTIRSTGSTISNNDSPTLLGGRRGGADHLLQVCDKDDATSALSEQPPLKPEISLHNTGLHNAEISIPDSTTLLDYQQMDYVPRIGEWASRGPALGSDWYRDYCSSFHVSLSLSEESTGLTPVVRPGGIHLKDNLLLVAATAKAQGKNVGIPKCEGAATAKTPWNATDQFDVTLLEGETVREWLFFDKHKRAFESGRRKQRSLPDHSGRGWHESRKFSDDGIWGTKEVLFHGPPTIWLFPVAFI